VNKVLSMADRNGSSSSVTGVRDRRYAIRFPFAGDVELIDLETGQQVEGVTSDISLGGCFVCTSKPLPVNARARLKLVRKSQVVEALVVVRIVKPRIGMGIEFFDLEPAYNEILLSWLEALRQAR
jgi:PilZ domain